MCARAVRAPFTIKSRSPVWDVWIDLGEVEESALQGYGYGDIDLELKGAH
jgi:hypothetical protein